MYQSPYQDEVMAIFERTRALIRGTHVVYASGLHGEAYVDKKAACARDEDATRFGEMFAEAFADLPVGIVLGPATGGIVLAQRTARWLAATCPADPPLPIFADKTEDGGYSLSTASASLITGQDVLLVEDILTTGGTIRKVGTLVRGAGGNVVGLGAICNRGRVGRAAAGLPETADSRGLPRFVCLSSLTLDAWAAPDCPLCACGVPINTDVGKGREYLESLRR